MRNLTSFTVRSIPYPDSLSKITKLKVYSVFLRMKLGSMRITPLGLFTNVYRIDFFDEKDPQSGSETFHSGSSGFVSAPQ